MSRLDLSFLPFFFVLFVVLGGFGVAGLRVVNKFQVCRTYFAEISTLPCLVADLPPISRK